jgi:FkbM family methyltransferase
MANTRLPRWLTAEAGIESFGTVGKNRMFADLDDPTGRAAFFFGCNDGKIKYLFQRILRPNDICLDVGANYGIYAILAASIVGGGGQVHAFEPQKHLARLIHLSAVANHFDHLVVHPVALSNEDQQTELVIHSGDSGSGSLGGPITESTHSELVDCVASGPYLEDLGVEHIRLVKIDAEGHEAEIVDSMLPLIKAHPPDFILFEENEIEQKLGDNETYKRLADVGGYEFFEIRRTLLGSPLHPLNESQRLDRSTRNILAKRRDVALGGVA